MKLTWGNGIVISIILFMSFIVTLVVIMISTNVDLVAENYYQQEIEFNDEIQANKNFNQIGDDFKVQIDEQHLIFSLPQKIDASEVVIELKRPDNSKLDKSFKFNDTKTYLISTSSLKKGKYNYRVTLKEKGKDFVTTGEITLN